MGRGKSRKGRNILLYSAVIILYYKYTTNIHVKVMKNTILLIRTILTILDRAVIENDNDCFRSYFEQLRDVVVNSLPQM